MTTRLAPIIGSLVGLWLSGSPCTAQAPPLNVAFSLDQSHWDCDKRQAWCPEMVVVPAGSFLMGSSANELDRESDEGPLRRVTIAKPFLVGKFEVTFAAWDACVAEHVCSDRPSDEGWGRGRRPVINVSRDDTQVFVAWLSKKTGKPYRLLTEAEWEYAARAGTTAAFSTGHTITTDQAHFIVNSTEKYLAQSMEVGSFPANPWGLHDMHGNVGEWVADCYVKHYANASLDGSAVFTDENCHGVVRGGSWPDPASRLRSAHRTWYATFFSEDVVGFRVARTL